MALKSKAPDFHFYSGMGEGLQFVLAVFTNNSENP